jgi:hypothetical protein
MFFGEMAAPTTGDLVCLCGCPLISLFLGGLLLVKLFAFMRGARTRSQDPAPPGEAGADDRGGEEPKHRGR